MNVEPVTLAGRWVRLEPLAVRHAEEIFAAGREPEVWAFLWRDALDSVDDARAWIAEALQSAAAGVQLPFAIVEQAGGRVVGSTRYLEIAPADRRLEIGWTWLARPVWRTPVNTECKYLLLSHAFETLGCLRVQLKTDLRNRRSQQAIERLGAVREGILRKHMILSPKNNYQRTTVMYSIVDDEWPAVKSGLEARMREH